MFRRINLPQALSSDSWGKLGEANCNSRFISEWPKRGGEYIVDKLDISNEILENHLDNDENSWSKCASFLKKNKLYKNYYDPPISVIIPCRNESQFIGPTLKTLLKNTPITLLKDIIVIDDGSDEPMENFINGIDSCLVSKCFETRNPECKGEPIIRFICHEKSVGLMQSRIEGAEAADGSILMILDCHVLAHPNWGTSVLSEISRDPYVIVHPAIRVAPNWPDISTGSVATGKAMFFDGWTYKMKWIEVLVNDEVPILAGGLFAISRELWEYLGKYEAGLKQYKTENFELSFKAWLCGGRIKFVADVIFDHFFRPKFPYKLDSDIILANEIIVTYGWTDLYKSKFKLKPPNEELKVVIDRIHKFRKEKKCKDFQDYVDKFNYLFIMENLINPEFYALHDQNEQLCLNSDLVMKPCDSESYMWFLLFNGRSIYNHKTKKCLTYSNDQITFSPCNKSNETNFMISNNKIYTLSLCLTNYINK